MKNKKINFFIIGAPKCGTTAMASYLSEHKDIFFSDPKEPHYFATDFEKYRIKSKEKYMALFDNVDKEMAVGEGSVFYLYSKEAIKNIYDYNPDAKIIIMLRNPIEMVPSFHSELIHSADENILDFKDAWYSSELRKNGKKISNITREPKLLYYTEIAKYSEQLENVKKYFPEKQIKVILFDDFKQNVKSTYEDVLKFLEVPQDGRVKFSKINENKKIKNIFLNMLIKRLPKPITNSILKSKEILGIKSNLGILNKINDLNIKHEKREVLSKELKTDIIDNYQSDIKALSLTLNKDLTKWLK